MHAYGHMQAACSIRLQCVTVGVDTGMQGVDAVHPGVDALHSAHITIVKYAVNEHVSSRHTFLGVLFYFYFFSSRNS